MAKLTKEEIIASLKEMTVVELNELVKAVEEEFGVTAAAPVAAAAAAPAEETAAAIRVPSEVGTETECTPEVRAARYGASSEFVERLVQYVCVSVVHYIVLNPIEQFRNLSRCR